MIDPKLKPLVTTRGKLLTLKTMSKVSGQNLLSNEQSNALENINLFLEHNTTSRDFAEVAAKDGQRERSTIGMLNSGKIQALPSKKIDEEIEKAMKAIDEFRCFAVI